MIAWEALTRAQSSLMVERDARRGRRYYIIRDDWGRVSGRLTFQSLMFATFLIFFLQKHRVGRHSDKFEVGTVHVLHVNDVLFQKVTQAYLEKNPSAPIRSRT